MLLKNMATNATADSRTPIFFVGWITKLFKNYIRRTPTTFHKGVSVTPANLALWRSLNLIVDCNNRLIHSKDAYSRVWNPNDPDEILSIEDVPNRPPHPRIYPGSFSQGGGDFPKLHNLSNIMQETLQVSKNANSLGQSSSSQIRSLEKHYHHAK
ncbi:hypothetical protein Hanom_Chr11g00990001 [Helianthus anomalus]